MSDPSISDVISYFLHLEQRMNMSETAGQGNAVRDHMLPPDLIMEN